MAYRILAPGPGIKPMPPAVEAQSHNHWTSREVPDLHFLVATNMRDLQTFLQVNIVIALEIDFHQHTYTLQQHLPRNLALGLR